MESNSREGSHELTINTKRTINHLELYRLPLSLSDNIISWLEPTKKCNLYCEGCYSTNNPTSHKSIKEVEQDLMTLLRYRITDVVSIAGGEPLIHPGIVDIVHMVTLRGLKPVIHTNGMALTMELVKDLKKAGAFGFTFHIDSLQQRPHWTGKSESDLNVLRFKLAKMVASAGNLTCAFNATVYEQTLEELPAIIRWGQKHIDIVHHLAFVAFRSSISARREDPKQQQRNISSREIMKRIQEESPESVPCAYLNGTQQPDALKWLMTVRIGTQEIILGSVGPKFMELTQMIHHLRYGKYFGFMPSKVHSMGKWILPLAVFDPSLRSVTIRFLRYIARNPLRAFRPLRMQTIMIVQPMDFTADGIPSMCDGCPDTTVYNGELMWACRLDERLRSEFSK